MVCRIVERGKASGRADDNEETALRRVRIFHEQSEAPTRFLMSKGIAHIEVDATLPLESNLQRLLDIPLLRPRGQR